MVLAFGRPRFCCLHFLGQYIWGIQARAGSAALSVMLFGIFATFTLQRTGSLWFAIGFHAATDYAETFIYSVPDSGMLASSHLLNSSLHGPRWLTGGTVGPEGSVVDFELLLVAFFVVALIFPEKRIQPAGA